MSEEMVCDLCRTLTWTRWCEHCGVDYCEDCALGAHDAMHELVVEEQHRWEDGTPLAEHTYGPACAEALCWEVDGSTD